MRLEDSPFPPHWWGTSLEHVGLDLVRPDVGTYGRYEFYALPPVPFDLRGDFAWLATTAAHEEHSIRDEKAVENVQALKDLQGSATSRGLRLPEAFVTFMATPSLQQHVRSNTDCFLDLCPAPIRSPLGDGYLIRFLADSQGCIFWYLYLTRDGCDHAVVASPDFYGTEAEQWGDEALDPLEIVFCAESFEAFICRFWLENEIWFAEWKKTSMPDVGRAYIEQYRHKQS